MILYGKELGLSIRNEVNIKSSLFEKRYGRKPCLAVVLVGDNSSSCVYVKNKCTACCQCGFDHKDFKFENDISLQNLLDCINVLNNDESVDGILVQLPLPAHIDEHAVINSINPVKDVDGFTPVNMGNLLLGSGKMVACTPKGILRLLDYYNISTCGKNICVVGRSNIVGKPMAALLMQKDRNSTVTECNSMTPNLAEHLRMADIVISAAGKPGLITSDMVSDSCVIIDVGITRVEDATRVKGYRLCGDADFDNLVSKVKAITPVPGGVGPMTIAMLMENTLIAACQRKGIEVSEL